MKKIFAVSGGVDSVVMLHYFKNDPDIIVAHFDHGIRQNSEEDYLFVKRIARKYDKKFVAKRVKLGANCPEETARQLRYSFLRETAKEYGGMIYTAHHADDLVESVLINILRGTGWRGLAPLNSADIVRPLLNWTKNDIYRYAADNGLHFRLDQTNSEEKYLRNRVRAALINVSSSDKKKLFKLSMRQRKIADEVDKICESLPKNVCPRTLLSVDDDIAAEFLRNIFLDNGVSQTRPQLQRAINAIRSYAPGKFFSLDKCKKIEIGKYSFRIVSTD